MVISLSPTPQVTRFAPSPTGYLHSGHGYSAIFSAHEAGKDGRFLLRIEDIDTGRCREPFIDAIYEDMAWLGLNWETPVWRQSTRMQIYNQALDQLKALGLLYPCFCSRADIKQEIEHSSSAPHGPHGEIYPGTCRTLSTDAAAEKIKAGAPHSWRLDMESALSFAPRLYWQDRDLGQQTATPEIFGDIILARRDTPTCYHLAVTLDDAAQGITCVTRSMDLFPSTHIHRLLQHLLELPVPEWRHHALITDSQGQRLAKRDGATALRELRAKGVSAETIKSSYPTF